MSQHRHATTSHPAAPAEGSALTFSAAETGPPKRHASPFLPPVDADATDGRVVRVLRYPDPPARAQRSANRRGVTAEASVREREVGGLPLPLQLAEVSASGAFISSDLLLPIGAEVDLEFALPGRPQQLTASGKIVRVQHRGRRPGMGVTFDRMSPADRATLRAFSEPV